MRNRLLLTRRGTEKSINIMASYAQGDEQDCVSCFHSTKYVCLCCKMPVCNNCASFESNEETNGWTVGKSVGYCGACHIEHQGSEAAKPEGENSTENSRRYVLIITLIWSM